MSNEVVHLYIVNQVVFSDITYNSRSSDFRK